MSQAEYPVCSSSTKPLFHKPCHLGPGVTVLRVKFYIELPQSSRDMINGTGRAYRLTTFLGPDYIHLIPAAEFSCDILAVTLHDGPIDLLRPDFNLTSVKTDSTTIAAEIISKIIRLATPSILDNLFNQLCPGYSKEPHAALDHIKAGVLAAAVVSE
jgi:hypothetical protein